MDHINLILNQFKLFYKENIYNYVNLIFYQSKEIILKALSINHIASTSLSLVNNQCNKVSWLKSDSNLTLMELMLLIDGLICGIIFIKNLLILKISSKNIDKRAIINLNEEIIHKYNSIYKLNFIDRYFIYFSIYILNNFFNTTCNVAVLIIIPQIQNYIFSLSFINTKLKNYIRNKHIFIKYSISKMTANFIQQLHPQIVTIPNYHIFIIYNHLNINFIFNIVKNSMFILLLNILRHFKSTYYYYKGIKFAYMHSTGYLYNIIPLDNAIYLVNIVIKEKRYLEFEKIDVINGLFVLIINKYDFNVDIPTFRLDISVQMNLFKIFGLLSFVSLLKIIVKSQLISNINICTFLIFMYTYLATFNIKNIITSIIIYLLLIFNINNLIITLVIICNKIIYYWIEEIVFFIRNITNIKKVIKIYNKVNLSEYELIN